MGCIQAGCYGAVGDEEEDVTASVSGERLLSPVRRPWIPPRQLLVTLISRSGRRQCRPSWLLPLIQAQAHVIRATCPPSMARRCDARETEAVARKPAER